MREDDQANTSFDWTANKPSVVISPCLLGSEKNLTVFTE